MITETFSESDQAASARSVYLALTELASDNGSERFTATKALIAHRAGLSISTTERLLKGFEQKNLVAITRNRLGAWKQPNTYTLLTIRNGDARLRIEQTRSNPDRAIKKGKEIKETPQPPKGGGFRLRRFRNGAKARLTSMRNNQLQRLRDKLIDERNRGNLSREEKDAKREQLLEIKKLLKGRGIVYAASL
jgi:hypothetical protein